jgi:hypothetical protein
MRLVGKVQLRTQRRAVALRPIAQRGARSTLTKP